MDSRVIQSIVKEVLQQVIKQDHPVKLNQVPIAVSARHVHLSKHDLGVLLGASYILTKRKDLSQPNQFAAEETLCIAGPKGSIERVRILGPSRNLTQVEVSQTDAIKLGLNPPLRQSGNIAGSSPVTVIGPNGSIYLNEGLIIPQRHIHMSPIDAEHFGVEDGQYVQVRVATERPITFEDVQIRVSSSYRLEMHIDTDEANGGFVKTGQAGDIILNGEISSPHSIFFEEKKQKKLDRIIYDGRLLSMIDVQKSTSEVIRVRKSTIITDLAKETARDTGKKIEIVDV